MADTAVETIVDPRRAAASAGLSYVSDDSPGIRRRRSGKGFYYIDRSGTRISDPAIIERIQQLAIPPAYRDVWICRSANGHIQATGRDAKGRKQYRYHRRFRELRESGKYEHVIAFARMLPGIRKTVAQHLALNGMPRDKVLATVVHLLEATLIRIGNDGYARENESFGLTTLRNRHVAVEGSDIRFKFKGKSGKEWNLKIHDKRVAKIVRACQELPGQDLFQYIDDDGARRHITSQDVNAYLKTITGQDVTAKDFRTWTGTVLAALALAEFETFDSDAGAKRNIRAAIEAVSARLGNTPTICRKCYVHPEIVSSYLQGDLILEVKARVEAELRDNLKGLDAEEAAVLALLEGRLSRELAPKRRRAAAPA